MRGDYTRALEQGHQSSDPLEARVLGAMGRVPEAIDAARREEERFGAIPILKSFCTALRAALEGHRDEAQEALAHFAGFNEGEGLFYLTQLHAMLGLPEEALAALNASVDLGFLAVSAIAGDPYLVPLRHTAYRDLLERARIRQRAVAERFGRAGGPTLLAG
jgi:hypothetical protein